MGAVGALLSMAHDRGRFSDPRTLRGSNLTVFIEFKDQKGFSSVIAVKTTDLSISGRRAEDPVGRSHSGRRSLAPRLPSSEQSVLLESLARTRQHRDDAHSICSRCLTGASHPDSTDRARENT